MIRKLGIIILAIMLVLAGCSDDAEEAGTTSKPPAQSTDTAETGASGHSSAGSREYYSQSKGEDDVFTLMLYMCGSDLESETGAATSDINEILYADFGDNLNIIIETGGASEWQNSVIPDDTNMRWKATPDGLEELEDAGLKDMTDPQTLTDFVTFCEENYPADRYALILWDHGGGTVGGYAVDENFPDSEPMGVIEMNEALAAADLKFDFIGFDACLMATAETAFMLEAYADFMVASQRVEPGDGWYYTDWVTELGENTSMDTVQIGQLIADSFIESNIGGYYEDELTLSVLDLTYVRELFAAMDDFFNTAETIMVDGYFSELSKARYDSRDLTGNNEQVDIAYLVENMGDGMAASDAVMDALDDCVAYNAVSDALDNHNGLCLYFPYTELDKVQDAVDIYDTIGISDAYQSFITSFSSLMVGGQAYNDGGFGGQDESGFDVDYWLSQGWLDGDLIVDYEEFYDDESTIDELEIIEKGDDYVLVLSEEQWDLIVTQELSVYMELDDGSVYLGADNIYEFDDDGDLIIDFDYTWVAINGDIVPFYAAEDYDNGDDDWFSYGYVPCYVNGNLAEIEVVWDNNNPTGIVAGYRYTHGQVVQKGLIEFADGDEIEFIFEYFNEDGEYYEEGLVIGGFTVDGEMEVSYDYIGDADCEIYYTLYDIYQNAYWTESLYFTD